MSLALFGSTQSVSFECKYSSSGWGSLGTIYKCVVQNIVNITSLDEAQIDSIYGTHLTGYNNDNVEGFSVAQGQIHYFPSDLNKFFKNLKGISISSTGLKEIHQRDLKDFPKLMNLYLYSSDLEIIEENLFEFNPNLDLMSLNTNKITHIDPHVLDRLLKLKTLYIFQNTCINMATSNNQTALQNIIRTAQLQCTNLVYSNLEQQVKYLEFESQFLNSESLKDKIENLENGIKNSQFPNFFGENLKILNADLIKKITNSRINDANDKLVVQDSKITRIEEMLEEIIELINNN